MKELNYVKYGTGLLITWFDHMGTICDDPLNFLVFGQDYQIKLTSSEVMITSSKIFESCIIVEPISIDEGSYSEKIKISKDVTYYYTVTKRDENSSAYRLPLVSTSYKIWMLEEYEEDLWTIICEELGVGEFNLINSLIKSYRDNLKMRKQTAEVVFKTITEFLSKY